jgi:hypothetical protein
MNSRVSRVPGVQNEYARVLRNHLPQPIHSSARSAVVLPPIAELVFPRSPNWSGFVPRCGTMRASEETATRGKVRQIR